MPWASSTNGYAFAYDNDTGMAPWQDDFFTAAVGHAAELGFTKAPRCWPGKPSFPYCRMVGAGTCWIDGAIYAMIVRDSATSPIYSTIAQAYAASHTPEFNALACNSAEMAANLQLRVGEMTGYSSSPSATRRTCSQRWPTVRDVGGTAGNAMPGPSSWPAPSSQATRRAAVRDRSTLVKT